MAEPKHESKVHKIHTFNVGLKWTGERTWVNTNDFGPEMPGSPPPVFGGKEDTWTPEELMLASINSCMVSTFIFYSRKNDFKFISLECSTEGFLEHDGKGYVFTRMIVRPKLVVKSDDDIQTAIEYFHKAHEICFMGNSIKSQITVEPEVTILKGQQT